MTAISFETHPDRYRHWKLTVTGHTAHLTMGVELHGGLRDDYELKLNSYDLGVDIELADAVQRLRFEHPEVRTVVIDSAIERCFCAGANIPMLGSSTHSFKVNFCKFTNETRLYIEDASRHSGQKYLAAVAGPCAGGGYELAMACDEVLLIDDGSSAVSLPEVPLLAVLPGTGGLTRLVDKRKVRRDRADVFCTTEEGIRGKRAVEWGLVDAIAPRSKFDDAIAERAALLSKQSEGLTKGQGIVLGPLEPKVETSDEGVTTVAYRHVQLSVDPSKRTAVLTISAPSDAQPESAEQIQKAGADAVVAPRVPRARRRALATAGQPRRHRPGGRSDPRRRGGGPRGRPERSCDNRRALARERDPAAAGAGAPPPRPTPRRASSRSSTKAPASPARSSSSRSPPTAATCSRTTTVRSRSGRSPQRRSLSDEPRPLAPRRPASRRARSRSGRCSSGRGASPPRTPRSSA